MRYLPSDVKFPDKPVGSFAHRAVYLSTIAFPLAHPGR
ncbi:hypothetical protein PG5_32620 [Pseudomonas sp. G5(2012)]|nr:hypothetical protein PG5_32620 [Pseudomonas sp. G5(2012)]